MSIFYPDNDNRQARLAELTTDAGEYLQQANAEYAKFSEVMVAINARIAALYQKIGASAPLEKDLDILAAADIPMTGVMSTMKIATPVIEVVGFVAASRFLAPGLVSRLMASGLISEEVAMSSFVLTWGGEIVVGVLIQAAAATIIVGAVVVGIGLAIDLFEGSELRDELRTGIKKVGQIRADVMLNLLRSKKLSDDLSALKNSLDTLQSEGLLTEAVILNTIHNTVMPSIAGVEAITMDTASAMLMQRDQSRGSWTNEDAIPVAPTPAPATNPPSFIVRMVLTRPATLPAGTVLCPATPGVWVVPDGLYPMLRIGDFSVWPLSFQDHRNSVMIALMDKAGAIINTWQLDGISSVVHIHADPSTNMVCFTGDGGQIRHMTWSQLTAGRSSGLDGVYRTSVFYGGRWWDEDHPVEIRGAQVTISGVAVSNPQIGLNSLSFSQQGNAGRGAKPDAGLLTFDRGTCTGWCQFPGEGPIDWRGHLLP